jgi:hypothetical protein
MRVSPFVLRDDMDEDQEVPVLVSLGDEDVPVCEDGSCSL